MSKYATRRPDNGATGVAWIAGKFDHRSGDDSKRNAEVELVRRLADPENHRDEITSRLCRCQPLPARQFLVVG